MLFRSRAIAEGASGFDSPGTGSLVSGSSDSYSSELTDSAGTKALWFETKEDFLSAMKDIIHKGDNVLVKASHGMNFPDLVEALKHL